MASPIARHVLTAALLLGGASGAGGQVPCASTDDPCVISSSLAFDDTAQATIALGTRRLVIGRGATVTATSLDIAAGAVTIEPGGRIVLTSRSGEGGNIAIAASPGGVRVEADAAARATIEALGRYEGGTITIEADGDIVIDGKLDVHGGRFGAGGAVDLTSMGGDVVLNGIRAVDASGVGDSYAGQVTVRSVTGGITVNGQIDASAADGGFITLRASTTVTSSRAGKLNLRAVGRYQGDGGSLDISAARVALSGPIEGRTAGGPDGSGVAADVLIAADVASLDGRVDLRGGLSDGEGGALYLLGGDVSIFGRILAGGRGRDGCGGSVLAQATRSVVTGPIEVVGGGCGGGDVLVRSNGSAVIQGAVIADGLRPPGDGGRIDMRAAALEIASELHADARAGFGTGGRVRLHGCSLNVRTSADVSARGRAGTISLLANGEMTIAGTVTTGGLVCSTGPDANRVCRTDAQCRPPGLCRDGGVSTIYYGDPDQVPKVTGAVAPPTTPVQTTLEPCVPG